MDFLSILNDQRKLREIKKILLQYGIRLTSGALLSCFLLMNFYSKEYLFKRTNNEKGFLREFIDKSLLSEKELIDSILVTYQLTMKQFDICAAIAMAEASGGGYNYEEAFNVINTAYNRTLSEAFVQEFGYTLYDQMTAPNQFVVYQNGSYLNYLGRTDLPGYQAVIDFLVNPEFRHHYLSFRSNESGIAGEELVEGGNLYFNVFQDDDLLKI